VPAERLRVVLGPAISGAHYEVGKEVIRALERLGVDRRRWCDGARVDLRRLLAARFEALGVAADAIEKVGDCTYAAPDFASYRRDGEAAGRQWSVIYRADDG
jgi:copper oxidase (laccase) domain-containing protein